MSASGGPVIAFVAVSFLEPDIPGRPGSAPGSVDYRFARRQTLFRFRAGELTPADVCDAQNELMRVAQNCSQVSTAKCPVCGERQIRIVRYVFGPRLPSGGRAVASRSELRKLSGRSGDFRCFTVEVCTGCRWNHLLQIEPIGSDQQ